MRGRKTARGFVVGGFLLALAGAWGASAGPAAAAAGTDGYVLVDTAGTATAFGDATAAGSLSSPLNAPVVDGDMTPTGAGHVLVGADGGVFAFGDAPWFGGLVGTPLNAPIVAVDVTPTGLGYILAAADGGVFAFGDAPFRGSLGGMALNRPVVDIALNTINDGYRLAAADGGVFAFGNAPFAGSMAGTPLNAPVTAVMSDKAGPGYALVAEDGGMFAFGGFAFRGSLGGTALNAPVVDAVLSPTGGGYNLVGRDGGVFAFGDAPFAGSLAGAPRPRPIVTLLGLANASPTATDDAYDAAEDTALVVTAASGVLGNDTDGDGDALSASVATQPANGAVTMAADGSFTYTPAADFSDADTFTYTASDTYGGTDTGTVTVTVAGVSDAPVAQAVGDSTNEDTAKAVTLVATDADGDSLTYSIVTGPTHGSLGAVTGDSVTYTPDADYSGADSFTYKANDGAADSNTATVSLTVNAVNDVPVAVNDAYVTDEDTQLNVAAPGVLANDSDVEGSALTAVVVTGPTQGALTLNADGSFTYTPTADSNGADSFTYKADDGTADGNVATVNLTVDAVNDAPVAQAVSDSTPEDTAKAVTLVVTDADGDSLTYSIVTGPTHGSLGAVTGDSVTYTPDADYNGADSFTYKANDGAADSNTATVSLTVNAVNDAPVAVDDAYQAIQSTALIVSAPGVIGNDTDADPADILTAGNASTPAHGTVALNADGSFTYTPTSGYLGADSFTYDVSDGTVTDSGTVAITVVPPNETPTADATSASGNEDGGAITVTLTGHDADDDDLTFTPGTATNGLVTVPGAVDCTTTANTCTTTVTYTPSADFNGGDSFTYTVNDGTVSSAPATASITVTAVNDEPSFTKGADQTVLEDAGAQTVNGWATAIAAGPANESGQTVSFTVTTDNNALFSVAPAVSSGGALTYTPAANANGPATVSVTAVDDGGTANGGDAESPTQQFTITVTAVNDVPSFTKGADQTLFEDAGAQSVSNWATAISKGPADESAQTVSFTVTNDNNALFSSQPAVSDTGTLTYTSAPNAVGSATVSVSISDNGGTANGGDDTSDVQTFTVTVNVVNDQPSFTDDGDQTVLEDAGAQVVNGFVNTTSAGPADESAQTVTVSVTGTNNNALFSVLPAIDSTGTLTYTPAANANGTATVTAHAVDNGGTANGGDDTGADETFVITVTAVNDVPSFTKGADQTLNEDAGAQSVSNWATAISKGPADESAQTVSFTVTNDNNALFSSQPAVSDTGTLTYTGAANKYGVATVTVSISDNGGSANGGVDTSATQTFTITVNAVNDAPVATAKAFTVQANMKISLGGLLTGATDPNDVAGDATWSPSFTLGSITVGANCVGCTVSNVDNANGTFDFDPPAGGTGTYTVTYTVVDNGHPSPGVASAAQTITFTVNGPVIWFVDTTAGTGGTGRLSAPFNTLAGATTAMGSTINQRIFVRGGNVTGNVTLPTDGWLISEAATGTSFDTVMGITPPAGTIARPAVNGTQRTLTGTVTLGTNSVVRGFDLTPSSGSAGLVASSKNNLTVNQVSATTTNARAVDIQGSQGSTITLKKVSATTATSGIYLTNVNNTTSGSFSVTGDGSTAASGGVITGASGDGIHMENVTGVSLAWMTVTGGSANGIYGSNVTTFTLADSTVSNNGTSEAADHSGINVDNLLGTSSMTRITVFGSREDNVVIENTSGTASLTVSNSTIRDNSTATGNAGLYVNARGSASVTFTSTSNTFERNRSVGLRIFGESSQKMTATVTGGTYTQTSGVGLNIAANGSGGMQFNVNGGTVNGSGSGIPVNVYKGTLATGTGVNAMAGTVNGMTVTNGNSQVATGIAVSGEGAGAARIAVTNNNVSQVAQYGISVSMGNGGSTTDVTISGNTVNLPADGASGIYVESGTLSTDTTTVCADIRSNTVTLAGAANDIVVHNHRSTTTLRLPGYGGDGTDTGAVAAYLDDPRNAISDAFAFLGSEARFTGGSPTTCAAP